MNNVTQFFTVLGIPRGQGRARAAKMGKTAKVYKDSKDRQNEGNIRAQVVQQGPYLVPRGIPVSLTLTFHMPRPAYHKDSKGEVKGRFKGTWPVTHPDLDNTIKAVKDALNGVVWDDDCQVVRVNAVKIYGDVPRTEIGVREMV